MKPFVLFIIILRCITEPLSPNGITSGFFCYFYHHEFKSWYNKDLRTRLFSTSNNSNCILLKRNTSQPLNNILKCFLLFNYSHLSLVNRRVSTSFIIIIILHWYEYGETVVKRRKSLKCNIQYNFDVIIKNL